jgi:gamma-glutamyltranspeptidase/glutathione hydrolase
MTGSAAAVRPRYRKQPAVGSRAMAVTNHPAASGAAAQVLLEGGNAIDAAVAALFALTVVEPMMVGILGGGITHLRTADGQHHIVDGLARAPAAAAPDLYEPLSTEIASRRLTRDRANELGAKAVAVPGALAGWCDILSRFGTLSLGDVLGPAIRLAQSGFRVTPYLATNIADQAAALARDPGLSRLFLPTGEPLLAGDLLRQPQYVETLRLLAREGAPALYGGSLGAALVQSLSQHGGIIGAEDLLSYRAVARTPIQGCYRGHTIVGPPPPASSGVHIVQMLNLLEGFNLRQLGFGSVQATHLLAEAMAIAFADRAVATADPDFVDVPVARLISPEYAAARRSQIHLDHAGRWLPGLGARGESSDTTHLTVADDLGNVVSSTQTLNGAFGACLMVPEAGLIANNYMYNFDPHPGGALSIAPGKRVFTSMAPMMVLREERLQVALGLPGGLRIFPSAMQAIVNLIDHQMSLQEAVEAPRIFTEGDVLELEPGLPSDLAPELGRLGHRVVPVPRVGGGMNAIAFEEDGRMTGAACWRADGTPVAISGGLADAGISFSAT